MLKPMILDVECIVCNKSLQKINHDPLDLTRKMGKITEGRRRTPNWSAEEKKYLLELIKERKDFVVIKNNNGPHYSEEKDVAWNEILRELAQKFGSKFSGSSTKKVKTQWQNMRRIAREEIALIGPDVGRFTKQTLDVCNILDMIKDGVLKREDNLNDTMSTNIEIKTERLDEELNEPSCSGISTFKQNPEPIKPTPATIVAPSSDSSISDAIEFEMQEETRISEPRTVSELRKTGLLSNTVAKTGLTEPAFKVSAAESARHVTAMTMTDDAMEMGNSFSPFHRQLQEFFRFTSDEKEVKMESLKEERRVVRVMRETAELHKIIAEQKLKHVLWLKKQEMA